MTRIHVLAFALAFIVSSLLQAVLAQQSNEIGGIKTTVISSVGALETQPRRYEIGSVAYNSYHWQSSPVIMIELYNLYWGTGYEKYCIEVGYGQGANSGQPVARLIESYGKNHNCRITLGSPFDIPGTYGGQANKAIPIYCDVRFYEQYKVKITYLQNRVSQLSNPNEILINENPKAVDIQDFTVESILNRDINIAGNINVRGNGPHFFESGSLAIGTTDAKGYRLAVAGDMIAESVKVQLKSTWPDYVFNKGYKKRSLDELEYFITQNKHLPGIASAEEVAKGGVNLGEMNALLLEKIEELTLHLIELNKKVDEQKMELMKQQLKLEQLEK